MTLIVITREVLQGGGGVNLILKNLSLQYLVSNAWKINDERVHEILVLH